MKSIHDCYTLNNGVQIPCVAFGTYKAAADESTKVIRLAIEAGYRYFDTASFYGTEKYLGEAIRESGIPRSEFFITSKVWKTEMGYEETKEAFARTLDNLGTDYLDQYLIHWPLQLKGGISIRQYAARKGEPDFTQLTDHGIPVVPGTSFAGAIRHRIKTILQELKNTGATLPKEYSEIIDIAFGYVDKKRACSSNIIINESEIKNAKQLTMMRTGVSRLESAVKDGALYKEKTYVDGKLSLKARVKKGKCPEDEKWIIGVLLLALKDLQNGFLAVGGQTAIGRGLFSADGPIRIDGKEGLEDTYIAEAIKNMRMNGGGK